MAIPLLDKLNELLGRKKNPTPPAPTPEPPAPTPAHRPTTVDYIKAWKLLKEIPFHKLGRAVSASAVVVFFAISGVLAWAALFLKFMLGVGR